MSNKSEITLIQIPWGDLYFRSRLLCCLFASLAILALVGCNRDDEENKFTVKQESILENRVSPDTIHLSNLPDSLKSKPIFLANRPEPIKIITPKAFSYNPTDFHPLFPETRLKLPIEVQAEFSTIFRNYSTEEGIAVDVTSCSFADSKGNLWFGTFVGGLNKYNGKVFTRYTKAHGLISNEITGITEDKQGNIWIATSEGISKYDGSGFTTVYNQSVVYDILQDRDETYWFATENGLIHHTNESDTLYSKNTGLDDNGYIMLYHNKYKKSN